MKLNLALAGVVGLLFAGPAASKDAPQLVPIATYDSGLGPNGAEIISVRERDGIAALTNIAGSVDVLDLSNPAQPVRLRRVAIDTSAGTPNSVAVHPRLDYFLVATGRAGSGGAVLAYRISDGALLGSVPAGIQPDSIAISPTAVSPSSPTRPRASPSTTAAARVRSRSSPCRATTTMTMTTTICRAATATTK